MFVNRQRLLIYKELKTEVGSLKKLEGNKIWQEVVLKEKLPMLSIQVI